MWGVLIRLNCFIPFLLIILCTEDCEIFNPLAIYFGVTWFRGWSSWKQIISSTASLFTGVVAVLWRLQPFCLSMVPNASNLFISCFAEVLPWCFSGLFFHILYAVYHFWCLITTLSAPEKKLLRYPPTCCSFNVNRSLISSLNIIMASYINAAKGHCNGFK